MQKKELRKIFLKKRLVKSNQEIEKLSSEIIHLFLNHFNTKNKKICSFLPIDSKNEINTFLFFDYIHQYNYEIYTTKWNIESNELKIYPLNNKNEIKLNEYNIPEPLNDNEIIEINNIDYVIIPLLIFDKNGDRVGYGKGVYDLFLKKFNRNKTKFVGLCFFDPIEQIEDRYSEDIKLSYCITPDKVYNFEKQY